MLPRTLPSRRYHNPKKTVEDESLSHVQVFWRPPRAGEGQRIGNPNGADVKSDDEEVAS
jgi:hypothetical protein